VRVLIDGDPIVYRAGFAAQNNWKILRWHDVVDETASPEEDFEHEAHFAYKWEMYDFIEDMNLHPDEWEVYEWVDPLSEAYCLKIVKDSLQNIVDAVEGYLAESDQDVTEVAVYLSGSTNFRNGIATIPGKFTKDGDPITGYKANRKDSAKPYWYKRIRDYMVEVWGAVIFEGIEADDALAIAQWAEDEEAPQTIIATVDKDLRNVPGWHYNILHQQDEHISFKDAQVNFYRQLLTGDSVDNIPGCYRVPKKRVLSAVHEGMSEQDMYDAVLEIYEENIQKFPHKHGRFGIGHDDLAFDFDPGIAAKGALLENARLLWMLQHRDQLWTPPGQPDESIADAHLFDVEDEWDD
jgi:hypothetical protein